jgi:ABC-2 type transport system permease protein
VSVRATVRSLPTLVRIGFAEAVAYRAEMLVWMLSTTMPLVMLALFSAVARGGPIGRYGQKDFVAYFLATFVVRQLTMAWAAWEINFEVRSGSLATRLLRPISPVASYAIENLAAMPLRLVVAIPVSAIALWIVGGDRLAHGWGNAVLFLVSCFGAWLLTFLVHIAIGTLSLWIEQSLKVMDVWFAGYLVFSGYLVPVELFPPALAETMRWLPFRYQIGLPVEILLGTHGRTETLGLVAVQFGWVALAAIVTTAIWQRGLRRFSAYGG